MSINGESYESMQQALRLIQQQNADGRLVNLFQHGTENIRNTKTNRVYSCTICKGVPGNCFGFGSAGGQSMLEAIQAAIADYDSYAEYKATRKQSPKSQPKRSASDILSEL